MAYNFNHQSQLVKPNDQVLKHIAPGKYIDIDERYYLNDKPKLNHQTDAFGRMGKPLKPFGENVNYQSTSLIEVPGGLNDNIKVNYGSYLYNQITGWDIHHPN